MTPRVPITTILLCCVLLAGPARGDSPSAKGLLDDAIYQYAVAEFEKSIKLLKRARKLSGDPALKGKVLLYLGVNHAVMGKRRRARAAFRQALTLSPGVTLEPEKFKARVVKLFEQTRAKMKGGLRVISPVPGATVLLDGRPVGPVPYRGRLSVGAYQIEVRGPDGTVVHAERAVVRHKAETRIEARPKPVEAKVPPPPPRDTSAAAPPPEPAPTPRPPAEPGRKRGRLWTWIVAGAAVAAGAVGLGLGLSARADYDEYERIPWDAQRISDLEGSIRGKSIGANISFATAGALAVTSVVLFFVEGRAGEQQATLVPSLAPGLAGLALGGRF